MQYYCMLDEARCDGCREGGGGGGGGGTGGPRLTPTNAM
jgi:hypothetical protein